MRKLQIFEHVSADGYFVGRDNDLSWTRHDQDPEYKQWADENTRGESTLVFGRTASFGYACSCGGGRHSVCAFRKCHPSGSSCTRSGQAICASRRSRDVCQCRCGDRQA